MVIDKDKSCNRKLQFYYEGSIFGKVGGGLSHLVGLANALVSQGHAVSVVLPSHIDVSGLDSSIVIQPLNARGPGPLRILDYEISRVLFLFKNRGNARSTIFMTRMSILGFAPYVARKLGFTTIVEVNGPIAYEIEDRILFGKKIARYILNRMDCLQLRSAHYTVSVSGSLRGYINSIYENTSVLVLSNGAEPVQANKKDATTYRAPIKNSIEITTKQCCYLGLISSWYDFDLLSEAIERLGDEFHLHVIGDGPNLQDMKNRSKDNHSFWGWLDRQDANEIMKHCEIGFIPAKKNSDTAVLRSPLKLYHYLSLGLKVIISDVIEIEKEVEPFVTRYKAGDITDLKKAIIATGNMEMMDIPDDLWSWHDRAKKLCNWIQNH